MKKKLMAGIAVLIIFLSAGLLYHRSCPVKADNSNLQEYVEASEGQNRVLPENVRFYAAEGTGLTEQVWNKRIDFRHRKANSLCGALLHKIPFGMTP